MAVSRASRLLPALTLLTLGRASLVDATGVIVAEQRRRIALLALLASAGDRGVARDRLMACLNPESPTESARHALHQLLYYLRRQVGDEAFIGIDPLRLDQSTVTWDVAQFEAALDARNFAGAVALYHGPFLDGLSIKSSELDFWIEAHRTRLAAKYADALAHLAGEAEASDDWAAAAASWNRLATLDPLNGRYALGVMRVLAAAGDSASALRHFRAHASLVRAELGSDCDGQVRAFGERLTPSTSTPEPAARSASPPVRRLAVMPLASAFGDATSIADDLTRELISSLTAGGVRVIGYQSVARYAARNATFREIARAFDVDAIATGRFERRGRTVRIVLEIASPLSGENRWTTSVAVDPSAISELAGRVSRQVATWIASTDARSRSARVKPPAVTSAEAYTSYLLGMRHVDRLTAADMREAIADLERAIVADPLFAPAHAGLAFAMTVAVDYAILPAEVAFRAAEPAIDRALRLDPDVALTHLAKARVLQLRDWNWAEAENEYRRALDIEASPRTFSTFGWFLEWYAGRADEGVAMAERAVNLDPSSALVHLGLAWRLRGADRLERAVEEAHIGLALDSAAAEPHWILAEVYLRRADFDRAEYHAREYILAGSDEVPANSTTLGEILARTGRETEARAYASRLALRATQDGPSLVALARTEMALGDNDRALTLLEQAVARRVFTIPFQPYWDPIRAEPRYRKLLATQGL